MTREIIIRPVLNGFVVQVGCQTVVFDSPAKLVEELTNYLQHPKETEENYRRLSCNRDLLEGPALTPGEPRTAREVANTPLKMPELVPPRTIADSQLLNRP